MSFLDSPPDNTKCDICLRPMESGQGQGIFTSECTHYAHYSCMDNIGFTYDNILCPICPAKWNDLPITVPNSNTNVNSSFGPNPVNRVPEPQAPVCSRDMYEPEPILFSDDEPLHMVTADPASPVSSSDDEPHNVSIKAIPERVVVASSESVSEFAVLVKIMAPWGDARAPIDLVAVLDVSGSMNGSNLELLKSAAHFVINHLGPSDRLSIVSFSTHARRILPLHRMTEQGRENAKQCVNSLYASGSTNILEALKKGVQVLEQRRYKDPVSSIIFLSDGRDTCYSGTHFPRPGQLPQYLHLLPASIYPENRGMEDHGQQQTFPVHAFSFSVDVPVLMHAISDASGGSLSSIHSYEMEVDDFGRRIDFLLFAVAQELQLMVSSASHGVQIRSIYGRCASEISNEGSRGLINVGNFYSEEKYEFIVNLSIPVFQSSEDGENDSRTTPLLDITCSCTDVVSNEMEQIDCDPVTIRRPQSPSPLETTISLEVDRERNRLSAEQVMSEARIMAHTGDLRGACSLLSNQRSVLLASASGQAGDVICVRLEDRMKFMEDRMGGLMY